MADDLIQPKSAVAKYFFTPLYYPRSPFDVIAWWERRRLAYNITVGTAGLVSLGTLVLLAPGPGSTMNDFGLLIGVAVYGVAANACYTLGWVADLWLRRTLGIRAPDIGPVLLRYGFVFSVGLSLLPIPVAMIGRLIMMLFGRDVPH
jgi:hypothetical protein